MPVTFLYLGLLLLIICIWFILFKRPIYEAVLLSFIILLLVTGTHQNTFKYIYEALNTSLIYSMTAFVAMSVLMTKTKVIDGSIAIILALLGKFPGGSGYAFPTAPDAHPRRCPEPRSHSIGQITRSWSPSFSDSIILPIHQ